MTTALDAFIVDAVAKYNGDYERVSKAVQQIAKTIDGGKLIDKASRAFTADSLRKRYRNIIGATQTDSYRDLIYKLPSTLVSDSDGDSDEVSVFQVPSVASFKASDPYGRTTAARARANTTLKQEVAQVYDDESDQEVTSSWGASASTLKKVKDSDSVSSISGPRRREDGGILDPFLTPNFDVTVHLTAAERRFFAEQTERKRAEIGNRMTFMVSKNDSVSVSSGALDGQAALESSQPVVAETVEVEPGIAEPTEVDPGQGEPVHAEPKEPVRVLPSNPWDNSNEPNQEVTDPVQPAVKPHLFTIHRDSNEALEGCSLLWDSPFPTDDQVAALDYLLGSSSLRGLQLYQGKIYCARTEADDALCNQADEMNTIENTGETAAVENTGDSTAVVQSSESAVVENTGDSTVVDEDQENQQVTTKSSLLVLPDATAITTLESLESAHAFGPGLPADEFGTSTAVVAMLRPAEDCPGLLTELFSSTYKEGLYLSGMRLGFLPEVIQWSTTVSTLAAVKKHSLAQGPNRRVLFLCFRGPRAAEVLRKLLGPSDPILARLTDPTSVNARYGGEERTDCVAFPPPPSAAMCLEETLWAFSNSSLLSADAPKALGIFPVFPFRAVVKLPAYKSLPDIIATMTQRAGEKLISVTALNETTFAVEGRRESSSVEDAVGDLLRVTGLEGVAEPDSSKSTSGYDVLENAAPDSPDVVVVAILQQAITSPGFADLLREVIDLLPEADLLSLKIFGCLSRNVDKLSEYLSLGFRRGFAVPKIRLENRSVCLVSFRGFDLIKSIRHYAAHSWRHHSFVAGDVYFTETYAAALGTHRLFFPSLACHPLRPGRLSTMLNPWERRNWFAQPQRQRAWVACQVDSVPRVTHKLASLELETLKVLEKSLCSFVDLSRCGEVPVVAVMIFSGAFAVKKISQLLDFVPHCTGSTDFESCRQDIGNVETWIDRGLPQLADTSKGYLARLSCNTIEYILEMYDVASDLGVKVVGIEAKSDAGVLATLCGQHGRMQGCADALWAKTGCPWKINFD